MIALSAIKLILDRPDCKEMAPSITDPNSQLSARSWPTKEKQPSSFAKSLLEVEEQVTREAILAGVRPDGRDFKSPSVPISAAK